MYGMQSIGIEPMFTRAACDGWPSGVRRSSSFAGTANMLCLSASAATPSCEILNLLNIPWVLFGSTYSNPDPSTWAMRCFVSWRIARAVGMSVSSHCLRRAGSLRRSWRILYDG